MLQAEALETRGSARRQFSVLMGSGGARRELRPAIPGVCTSSRGSRESPVGGKKEPRDQMFPGAQPMAPLLCFQQEKMSGK